MTKNRFSYEELEIQIAKLNNQIEELSAQKAKSEEDSEILNLFLEHSPVYFFLIDEKVRAVRLSKNFEKLLGFPIEEMIGSAVSSLIKTDTAKFRDTKDLQILDNNVPVQYDDEVMGRITTTYRFPVKMDGKPSYLAGFVIDNTDRVLAERALIESEKKFRILFNMIPNPIIIIKKQTGNIIEINDYTVSQYGYSREELIDQYIAFIVSEEGAPTINSERIEVLFQKKFHKKKNSDVFPVSINITSFTIKDEDFLIISVHDISSQVLSEQNRKEMNENIYLDKLQYMENRLNSINQQLTIQALNLNQQKSINNNVLEMLADLTPNADNFQESINTIRNKILSGNKNTNDFQKHLNSLDNDFLKKLNKLGYKLSTNEVNLCSYLHLNLSTKEISKITHQSIRSIEVARYKLRKKLNLGNNENLNLYLSSL